MFTRNNNFPLMTETDHSSFSYFGKKLNPIEKALMLPGEKDSFDDCCDDPFISSDDDVKFEDDTIIFSENNSHG
jgi:hypothetical protein